MFKIGDCVKRKRDGEFIGKVLRKFNKITKICSLSISFYQVVYTVQSFTGEIVDYLEEELELLELPTTPINKTNKINYKEGQGIISWELVDKNNLKVKIHNGRLNIVTLLKILIYEIGELREFNYKRISPYKIEWERPMHREDKSHVYKIVFIDVKDNNKIKESEIIKLNGSMSLEEGEYEFFIPDLLEVARLKGLVKLEEDIYKYVENKFVNGLDIKYIDDTMSKENLEANGWIVPTGYVEQCNN